MAAADLLAESLRGSEQLGGGLGSPGDRERFGEAGETLDDQAGHLEVALDAKRFSQHRQGIVDPALVAGELRQLVELGRSDCPVVLSACLAQDVLVSGTAAFEITELAGCPSNAVGRDQCVVLLAELAEAFEALLEVRPGACPVSLLARGHPEREDGVGDAPRVTKLAMQSERLL